MVDRGALAGRPALTDPAHRGNFEIPIEYKYVNKIKVMNNGEIKVADVRNWVLNNMFNNGKPSKHDIWFADKLEKYYLNGLPG